MTTTKGQTQCNLHVHTHTQNKINTAPVINECEKGGAVRSNVRRARLSAEPMREKMMKQEA